MIKTLVLWDIYGENKTSLGYASSSSVFNFLKKDFHKMSLSQNYFSIN